MCTCRSSPSDSRAVHDLRHGVQQHGALHVAHSAARPRAVPVRQLPGDLRHASALLRTPGTDQTLRTEHPAVQGPHQHQGEETFGQYCAQLDIVY